MVVSNATLAAEVAKEFVVDKVLFWLTLIGALAGTATIGFKISTWLRKKASKDKDELMRRIDENEKRIMALVKPDEILNKFEKYDNMFAVVDSRLSSLEKQILTQMTVVLEGQKKISEFIEKYRA